MGEGKEGSFHWSGREDLNLRPQRPERCALTSLRYAPSDIIILLRTEESKKRRLVKLVIEIYKLS